MAARTPTTTTTAAAPPAPAVTPAAVPTPPPIHLPPVPPPAAPAVEVRPAATLDAGDALAIGRVLLKADVEPIFAVFSPPVTTAKLWAALAAIGKIGPAIDAVLSGGRPAVGAMPDGSGVVIPCGVLRQYLPASDHGPEEVVAHCREAMGECECAPPVTGGATGPAVKLNPRLAGLLIALIDRAIAAIKDRLANG